MLYLYVSISFKPYRTEDGQLLYADLDFDPNEIPVKVAAVKRPDPPTEYVDIDYVKTAANKNTGNTSTPLESENIYANQ